MNEKDNTIIGARGVDVYSGVANPTISSISADPLAANFVRVHPVSLNSRTDFLIIICGCI
jgi:hypothetical protein